MTCLPMMCSSWTNIMLINRCLQQPKKCEIEFFSSWWRPIPTLIPVFSAMAPKTASTENKGNKVRAQAPPTVEKYDWARTQGPDPRDERTLGSPCFGNHVEQPPGKGSTSGSNQWARWTGCAACGLRLSYTPTWGSHGMTRAAGPLCQDVRQQLEIKKPEKGSVELNNKKIS